MEIGGAWRAVVADEERRRTWLDDAPDALDEDGWQPVSVPGHWQRDAAFADATGPLLYRTPFEHPGPSSDDERWWLRFDGVLYQGDVWLDGAYVGDTEGYFFPHAFEVTDALRTQTEHVLGVDVTCAPPGDRRSKRSITGSLQHAGYLDPAFDPGGIWRPVTLERTGPIRIRHLRVLCRDASATLATVAFRAVIDAAEGTDAVLRTTVGGKELVDRRRLAAGENQVEWTLGIDEPELWWPHALGEQPLHDVAIEVTPVDEGDEDVPAEREPSDRRTCRIGLREVHLRNWILHVNGERLFTKGANLTPTRAALGEATPDELRRDVDLAKTAGLDLVRLHAHVSLPALYDAADEAGMLVWQDFPLHRGYARSIRKQAVRQAREMVDLLAHHPSVAIWCAHDEPFTTERDADAGPDEASNPARWLAAQQLPSWNRSILDRSVKRAIERADGSRPVIAHSGVLPHPPQLDGTDAHLSFGWLHGDARDLPGLARALPRLVRFVSELGAQSVPDTADFAEPERWPDLDWDRLAEAHGMQRGIFERRVPPADHPTFDAWRVATQELQAEVVRHQVEALRRLKYRPTGGFAVFHLADAHPAISWSLLDHERVPKLAYAALREVCRPVIATADRLPAELVPGEAIALDVHVISDRREPVEDLQVRATLRWEGGEQRWRFGGAIAADAVARVGTLQIEVPSAPGPVVLELSLTGPSLGDEPIERLDRSRIVDR
jgi:beta-mannosidase